MSRCRRVLLLLASAVVFLACAFAGTNGILEGSVRDKSSREIIPGVNIAISVLQRGTVTDASGRFELQNLPAGQYDVRFSHVGHRTSVVRNVTIHPDLRTRLTIDLEPTSVELGEITVFQEKPLIQKDVTGTTFTVSGEEVNLLPINNVTDVLGLQPGVTLEGNVRGGKVSEVVYLVDGLPVKDVLSGDLTINLPKSSIVGISMYTGGFEAQYGNALSGVVNIVTRTGTNTHQFTLRAASDHLFGGTQVSRSSEFDASAAGPIAENKAYYFASVSGFLTDTRWWQDFQYYLSSPIDRTLTGFGKVEYLLTPTRRLGLQFLVSDKDWHDYEFNWRFNLAGLPRQQRTSYRIAAMFTDSPSDEFFYVASLSRFALDSQIGDGSKEDVPVNDPYQYDFGLRYIIDGKRAWWSSTTQSSYTAKFDGTWNPSQEHLVKVGGEVTLFDLTSDLLKLEPKKTYFGKPMISEPQLTFASAYTYRPRAGSFYIQDKIDVPSEGLLLNLGLRYDFLDPTASRPQIEAIPVADTAYKFNVLGTTPASFKQQVSPRFGAAMQFAENGYLFINLGWYFQYPMFDYLYTGLDRVALAKGLSALTGNPDLEPERTMSYEMSVKYGFVENITFSITYFHKESTNLVDTKTFVPGDSKLAGSFGFAEYVNNPFAATSGVELVLARERGKWLTGELSYTYMNAEGLSGSAQDGFYIAQFGLPPAIREYPLSWDQRHMVKLVANVTTPWDLIFNTVIHYHSGRPYTNYPTATGFEPVNGGLFAQNNARMPSYANIDFRIEKAFNVDVLTPARFKVYVDVRNALDTQNVMWMDSNGRIGGELADPSGYYIGRRTFVGVEYDF
jgi:outer membrane receptor for ferrienterochelin and colicin